jgi:hypothetical protein
MKFCMLLITVISLYKYYRVFITPHINLYNNTFSNSEIIIPFYRFGSSSLFHIELISLWISEHTVLAPTCNNFVRIRCISVPGHLYLFSFSIGIQNSKDLGSGANGSAVSISVCLTSSTA